MVYVSDKSGAIEDVLGQAIVVGQVEVAGAGNANVLVRLIGLAVRDRLGGTGVVVEVVATTALRTGVHSRIESVTVADGLDQTGVGRKVEAGLAGNTNILVVSEVAAVSDALGNTGSTTDVQVVALDAADAGIVGTRGGGTVADVDASAGVGGQVVAGLAG